ncbi:ABC transporter substrate-binding protein [Bacteroidota bacterium]
MRLRLLTYILLGYLTTGYYSDLVGQTDSTNYGNTPEELLPFGRFQNPYIHFFEEPMEFRGSGRDKKPPSNLESVKIGFLGPLEGTIQAPMGNQMLQGTILAVEEANENGGYKGIPFEIVARNDVGLWGAAANEVVRLDDEGVWAIIGSINDIVSHVAIRVALKLEIPWINTGDPDPTFTETRIPWVIRVIGDDRQSGYTLAIEIFKSKGYSDVALFRVNNRYGRVGIMEFNDAATRMGYPLNLHIRYGEGETDFTTQLERIKKSRAEAVVLWTNNGEEAAMIIKQMRDMDMDQSVYACDRVVTPEFLEHAGNLANGVVSTYPYNPTLNDPKLQAFNKKYRERFGMDPDVFAAHAYDGMCMVVEAINNVGLNRVLIRDVLTDLKTFQGYNGVTGKIVFDASWNDIGKIWLVEVVNGDFVFKPSPVSKFKLTGRVSNK